MKRDRRLSLSTTRYYLCIEKTMNLKKESVSNRLHRRKNAYFIDNKRETMQKNKKKVWKCGEQRYCA